MGPARRHARLPRAQVYCAHVMGAGLSSEADARYLAEIRADVGSWVGRGATLLDLRCEPAEGGVRLVARYRLGARERESSAAGESVYAAHTALRATILFDRLRFGFEDAVARH